MDTLSTQLANLDSFKLEHRIISQVVAQLQKDFDDIIVDVELKPEESPYVQLKRQLIPIIDWLLEKRPERLFSLFYRIDIPEQVVKSLLVDSQTDLVEAYTDQILNRELQKVITRNFYSAMSSE